MDVRPLTGETWDALAELFREGGDPRWCWCQFWRLRSRDFAAAKVPELRERLRSQAVAATQASRVESRPASLGLAEPRGLTERLAEPPGLVGFESGKAVGWVSLGPRDAYERIVRSKVIPKIDDRPVWSIVCFAVSAPARGRGVTLGLLEAAIDFARLRGAVALEAYPVALERSEPINPDSAYTGTLPMFERAGFRVVADRASDPSSPHRRVVVRKELAKPPTGQWEDAR